MKRTNLLIFILLILIIALGLAIYLRNSPIPEETVEIQQPAQPQEPVKKPIVHYPVSEPVATQESTESAAAEPVKPLEPVLPERLPAVQDSDQSIQEALASLFNGKNFYELLYLENFIQRFVTTIDNLTEKRLPRAHLPVRPPGGQFIVSGTAEEPQTSSRNHSRYTPYLTMLETVDQDLAMKVYRFFYPLFQSAYEQLGYKNVYFNDRLVFVIDHLLQTPNPPEPILLAQPVVLYTYADQALENRSAGQKLLLRIGQEQRLRVFKILNQYRQRLTTLEP